MGKEAGKLVAFISEPPIIEISGGVVRVEYRSGTVDTRRAMSVRTFSAALDRGKRALERYAAGEENVIVDD